MPEDEKPAPPSVQAEPEGVRLFTRKGLVLVLVLLLAEAGVLVLVMTMFGKESAVDSKDDYKLGVLTQVEIGNVEVLLPDDGGRLLLTLSLGLDDHEKHKKQLAWAQKILGSDAGKTAVKSGCRDVIQSMGKEAKEFRDRKVELDLKNQIIKKINAILNNTSGRKKDASDVAFPFVVKVHFTKFQPFNN